MKKITNFIIWLCVVGFCAQVLAVPSDALVSPASKVPQVIYDSSFSPAREIISFGSEIVDMAYSPDGRYLALVYGVPLEKYHVVIWDVQKNKEQTRVNDLYVSAGVEHLIWGKDSSYFTFQMSNDQNLPMRLYSPLDGHVIKEIPIWCYRGSFNHDYSKLLCYKALLASPATYRIYNTTDWSYVEHSLDLGLGWLVWTADDRILIAGAGRRGEVYDGLSPHYGDLVFRLIDPNGNRPSQSNLLPATPRLSATLGFVQSASLGDPLVNFNGNKVANSDGLIVDTQTLAITKYEPDDVLVDRLGKYIDRGFSPDGHYLFLLMASSLGNQSAIVDTNTGKTVGNFEGAGTDMSVRPDGLQLAIAQGKYVLFYKVQ